MQLLSAYQKAIYHFELLPVYHNLPIKYEFTGTHSSRDHFNYELSNLVPHKTEQLYRFIKLLQVFF